MINNKLFVCIFINLSLIQIKNYSQEKSIFCNYYLNQFIINPAITGSEYYPVADFLVKKQWVGIPNSPSTVMLSGNYRIGTYGFYDPKGFVNKGPLILKDRIGLGAAIYKDKNGPSELTGGLFSYAYHLPINSQSRISFGMSIMGSYYSFRYSELNPIEKNDPYLFSGSNNIFRFNINFGLYHYSDNYFTGISILKLLPDIISLNELQVFQPSYYFLGGVKLFKKNQIIIEPSLIFNIINSKDISTDIFTKFYLKKTNWIAISYSTTQKLSLLFGIQLKKMLYLGYNFEFNLNRIANYTYGNHVINLGINLGLRGSDFIRYRSNND